MTNYWTHYGARQFAETFNSGGDLAVSADAMLRHWQSGGQPGEIFCGWTGWAVRHLVAFRRQAGVAFDGAHAWLNGDADDIVLRLNGALADRRMDAAVQDVSKICGALAWLRQEAMQSLSVTFPHAAEDEALAVRIVSQPVRVTTTTIERDKDGNIVETFQKEQDAG